MHPSARISPGGQVRGEVIGQRARADGVDGPIDIVPLAALEARWDARFPMISRKWRANWANHSPFFAYRPEIRRVMYTTNAIKAINAQLRKVTKKRGSFPNPEAVRKVLYLAIIKASERWTRSTDVHAVAEMPEPLQGRTP